MIYVKRDPAVVPERLLKVAERAQAKLDSLPPDQRKAFIEKKAHVWRAFGRCLSKMSYGKCWYSESNDPQSFFDVDHFRPKKAAKRADGLEDDGYPWLAFSWENFCYAAGRSNRLSTDEVTEQTVGKGSWFPLLAGSCQASWDDRCQGAEQAVLLDPTLRDDVALIDIHPDDGRAVPSISCLGAVKQQRVDRSVEIYGLNLGNLISTRKRVMREVWDNYLNLQDIIAQGVDMAAVDRLQMQLRQATMPSAPYARAARAKLHSLPFGGSFCAQPEDQLAAA